MKINGKKIEGPNEEIIIIPRGESDIVFKAQAVLSYDEFDKICPFPEPPMIRRKGAEQATPDYEDKKYIQKQNEYIGKRTHWMILKSIEATDGLEFETVKMSDPETWGNYEKEFKDAGFSEVEINRIIIGVQVANCLSESRLQEARKRFLASQQAPTKK